MVKKIFFLILSVCNLKFLVSAPQCLTTDYHLGICIHFTKCQYFNEIANDDNSTEAEIYYLQDNLCMDDTAEMVCCKILLPNPVTACGTITTTSKIVNGMQTPMFQHPWTVLLYYTRSIYTRNKCGGSLINQRYVVTAAHCAHPSLLFRWKLKMVKLGVWNASATRECSDSGENCADHVQVEIDKIIIHENYEPLSEDKQNDIALLRLNRDIQYTDFIRPICLPPSTVLYFSHTTATAVGWGRTDNGSLSTSKMHVDLHIIKLNTCQTKYNMPNVSVNQICAGAIDNRDSCDGDSGGPLVAIDRFSIPNESYQYLSGIVSHGPIKCGTINIPGIYTNVSMYIPWIKSKLRP